MKLIYSIFIIFVAVLLTFGIGLALASCKNQQAAGIVFCLICWGLWTFADGMICKVWEG